MAVLLLKLKNIPEDEYQDVCELLEKNQLGYYETNVGFWGVGMAGIWLHDESQLERAHSLLDDYMTTRQLKVREQYEDDKKAGRARTLGSTFANQPVTFILYMAAIIGILALSILPFLGLS